MKYFTACALLAAAASLLQDADAFSVVGKMKNLVKRSPAVNMPPLAAGEAGGVTYPDKDLSDIFAKNVAWKKSQEDKDPEFFTKLGSVHKPTYFWIGCADARVPANEIMGEPAGSVFVARNVANMVVNTDFNLMSALQYAVAYLKIPHIIVCGHYECGGVRAAVSRNDHMAPLENWLRNIRDVYRLHQRELDSIRNPDKRHRRLVELNVIEQCINVYKTGIVQRRRVETYQEGQEYTTPRIHGLVFDPKDGRLVRLNVDFNKYSKDLNEIYDLYDAESELPNKEYA